jgi:hypothetical protein
MAVSNGIEELCISLLAARQRLLSEGCPQTGTNKVHTNLLEAPSKNAFAERYGGDALWQISLPVS